MNYLASNHFGANHWASNHLAGTGVEADAGGDGAHVVTVVLEGTFLERELNEPAVFAAIIQTLLDEEGY